MSIIFALSTTYYEILHWFTNFGQGLTMLALLLTFVFLQKSLKQNSKIFYYLSVASSFFIPMNFSMGFLGIFFITLYLFFGEERMKTKTTKEKILILLPYIGAWFFFLCIYLAFSYTAIINKPATAPTISFNILTIIGYILIGFLGIVIKTAGFNILIFPYTTVSAILFILLFFWVLIFSLFYFTLNSRRKRIPLAAKNGVAIFALGSITLCYMSLAVTRSSLGVEAFLNWGRYHYLPYFFAMIFLGAIYNHGMEIFGQFLSKKRVKALIALILILFVINNFFLIRQKAESVIRTEGLIHRSSKLAV